MKKIFVLFLLIVMGLVFFGCGENLSGTNSYENEKYLFTMTLPDSWTSYDVSESSFEDDLYPGSEYMIQFDVAKEEIFKVHVFEKAKWQELVANADGPIPASISANDTYAFASSVNQGIQSPEAKSAFKDVDAIVATFEFN